MVESTSTAMGQCDWVRQGYRSLFHYAVNIARAQINTSIASIETATRKLNLRVRNSSSMGTYTSFL